MDFNFSEEHKMIISSAREFAQNDLLPGIIERDDAQKFPTEQIKKLGELGFMGMMVSPEYGGSGMDTISYVLAMERYCNYCCFYMLLRLLNGLVHIQTTQCRH